MPRMYTEAAVETLSQFATESLQCIMSIHFSSFEMVTRDSQVRAFLAPSLTSQLRHAVSFKAL